MGSKHSFAGFSALEMKCIVLRVKGLSYAEIGERLGKSKEHVSVEIRRVYRKTGIKSDLATLRLWALEWGFDEPLPPESFEERARPGRPVPRYQRIKLGRIKRARVEVK